MKTKLLITLFLLFGLVAACAERSPHPMDMSQALQNAKTKADHESLAQHYEEAAAEMQGKVEEHKNLLSQYERKPWVLGKQATGFGVHCQNLIQIYSQAAEENLEMARMHREMAQ